MERAGDILRSLLEEGTLREGQKYISFYSSWEEIVGEPLCDHTKAVDVQSGSLTVQVDHPGWFQMFRFNEREILRKVKKRFPDLNIRSIKVRVVPSTETGK
jgi:predicted nucleic acid-binding Zn ribbon protein